MRAEAHLGWTETISYFITIVAVQRADCVVFPISPRNSPAAVAHLLQAVNVDHVLVGREPVVQTLLNDALETLKSTKPDHTLPETSTMQSFEELFDTAQQAPKPGDLPMTNTALTDIAIYFHSSGSTAFPKPIPMSNRRSVDSTATAFFAERDMTGKTIALQVMPMYHGMGGYQTCFVAAFGCLLSTFEPRHPAIAPTADGFLESARKTGSDIMFSVPSFLEVRVPFDVSGS